MSNPNAIGANELEMLSPAEQAIARTINAQLEAGEDPFGEVDEAREVEALLAAVDGDQAKAAELAALQAQGDDTTGTAAAPAAASTTSAPADEVVSDLTPREVPTTSLRATEDVAALTQQRETIDSQIAEVQRQWSDGEIDTAAMTAALKPLNTQRDDLLMRSATSNALVQANAQFEHNQQMRQIDALKGQAKAEGINYDANPKFQKQFNNALDLLESDPDNGALSFEDLISQAHGMVKALNPSAVTAAPSPAPAAGKTAAPAPAAPTRQSARLPAVPPSLRTMPSAERSNDGPGIGERLLAADAIGKEAMWERMTPAQRAAMLDD
jgi:hypothetical protein